MGKKSRPTSGQHQAPAAPVPLKPDPPAPGAIESADSTPVEGIEAQVDALLDQAQHQVQSMSELVNESARDDSPVDVPAQETAEAEEPASSRSPTAAVEVDTLAALIAEKAAAKPAAVQDATEEPGASAAALETPAPATADSESAPALDVNEIADDTDDTEPLDTEALQSQVDAILVEAGHLAEPRESESQPHDSEFDPRSTSDHLDGAAAPLKEAPGEAATEADLASVDAVIADAAQRALEADDFESIGAGPDGGDHPSLAPAAPASRTASTAQAAPVPALAPAAPPRRAAVVKGGDASMRREKPKKTRPSAADAGLDGNLRPPAAESPEAPAPPLPGAESSSWLRPLLARTAPGLRARIAEGTLQTLATMNSPWKSWSPATRKAILAITFVNMVLAVGAYVVLLKRLF